MYLDHFDSEYNLSSYAAILQVTTKLIYIYATGKEKYSLYLYVDPCLSPVHNMIIKNKGLILWQNLRHMKPCPGSQIKQ